MKKHNIKTIEQTMFILDNNPYVKFCLDSMNYSPLKQRVSNGNA